MNITDRHFQQSNISSLNLNNVLLGSFILAIAVGTYYFAFSFSLANTILSFSSAIMLLILMLILKQTKNVELIKYALVIYLNFFLLPTAWISTYGSKGPMISHSFLFIIISAMLVSSAIEYIIAISTIIEISLLWIFEDRYIGIIEKWSSSYNIHVNLIGHYILAGLILCVLVYFNRKNFELIENKLEMISMIDDLTLLYSRKFCLEELGALHEESRRTTKSFCIYMFDIDNFKQINDTLGHQAGDEVLKEFGEIIVKNIRQYDLGSRYGGDEFIVILVNADSSVKASFVKRIEDDFNSFAQKYNQKGLGISYGFAEGNHSSVDEIIKEADKNLYLNKGLKKQYSRLIETNLIPEDLSFSV